MKDRIKIFSPASIGNIGSGFDILGLCLENLGDEIELIKSDSNEVNIIKITGDNGLLPKDPKLNSVSISIMSFLKENNIKIGLNIILNKKMPINSGLGSSAASAVGGLYGISCLLNKKINKRDLLKHAMYSEKITSGSSFPDNVSAVMLGGIVLARSKRPLDVINLSYPIDLYIILIYQDIHLETKLSRSVLPNKISLGIATKQWGNISGLVLGLEKKDYKLIFRSVQDFIAEPIRSKFIPNFNSIKNILKSCPDNGFGISGSGPTICAFSNKDFEQCELIRKTMEAEFKMNGIKSKTIISEIDQNGTRVL